MTWILILMLLGEGKAFTQISGYTSQKECKEAGEVFSSEVGRFIGAYACIQAPKGEWEGKR